MQPNFTAVEVWGLVHLITHYFCGCLDPHINAQVRLLEGNNFCCKKAMTSATECMTND